MNMIKDRFFRTMLVIYAVLLGVLSLSFYLVFLRQQRNEQKELLEQELRNRTVMHAQMLDEKFNTIDRLADQIYQGSWRSYVSSKSEIIYSRIDYFRMKDICQEMDTINILLEIARSTAVLFPEKNLAVDDVSFWECERYFASVGLGGDWLEVLDRELSNNYSVQKLFTLDGTGKEGGDFVIARHLSLNQIYGETLFVLVDGRRFRKFINLSIQDMECFAIRLDGETIFSAGDSSPREQALEVVLPSGLYQWEYYYKIRTDVEDTIFGGIGYIFAGSMGILLMVTAASYLLTKLTYLPVVRLIKRLDGREESKIYGLDRIEHIYQELKTSKERMEELAAQYRQIGQNTLLLNLLSGAYDGERVMDNVRKFNLDFSEGGLFLVIVFWKTDTEGQDIFLDTMLKLLTDSRDKKIAASLCQKGEEYVIILETMEGEATLQEKREQISLFLDEYLPDMSIGMYTGNVNTGFYGIHLSYQEAKDKMVMSNTSRERTVYYYPLDMEMRMINQMQVGNFDEVRNILTELEQENAKRMVLPEIERRGMILIFECFRRFARNMEFDMDGYPGKDLKFQKALHMEELWQDLREQLAWMESSYKEKRKYQSIGRRIAEYLDENYTCSGIDQQGIADLFGISRPAVSTIFKDTMHINFTDYLHKRRVEHAKQLFLQGNYDVAAVTKASGFETEVTFKRVFVKHEGITPREYVKRIR